jgi:hypothetical protein
MSASQDDRILDGIDARLRTVERLVPPTPRWRTSIEAAERPKIRMLPGPAVVGNDARPRRGAGAGVRGALLVAALVLVAIGAGVLQFGDATGPTPSAAPIANLPESLRGTWIGLETRAALRLEVRDGSGQTQLSGPGATWALTLTEQDGVLTVEQSDTGACPAAERASYEWRFGPRGLVLSVRDEPCRARGDFLAGAWARAFPDLTPATGALPPGGYVVDRFVHPFTIEVPPTVSLTRTLDQALSTSSSEYWMVNDDAASASLVVVRIRALPVDACDAGAGQRPLEGADPAAAADAFAAIAGVTTEPATADTFGRQAVEFDVTAGTECARGAQLWTSAPGFAPGRGGESLIAPGATARVAIVEFDGDLVAFAIHAPAGELQQALTLLAPLRDGVLFE